MVSRRNGESNGELFVRVVLRKIKPFIEEEVKAADIAMDFEAPRRLDCKEAENLEYVSRITEKLLSRFYELGAQEATMYMPLIMAAIRKADKE